eukprot:1136803-Pelagomonas_calceolata.AAC.15
MAQAKALELLLAHVRTLANTASPTTGPASQGSPAAPASSNPAAASAAAALKPHMKAISAALVAAVAGVGMKAEHQADALKAAVGIVEAIKRLHPSSKLGEVMGPERINLVAKAVSTVRVRGGGECVFNGSCIHCAGVRRGVVSTVRVRGGGSSSVRVCGGVLCPLAAVPTVRVFDGVLCPQCRFVEGFVHCAAVWRGVVSAGGRVHFAGVFEGVYVGWQLCPL